MSPDLERAARALLSAIDGSNHNFGPTGIQATAEDAARACITAALLNPSDKLVAACSETIAEEMDRLGDSLTPEETVRACLRAAAVKITKG